MRQRAVGGALRCPGGGYKRPQPWSLGSPVGRAATRRAARRPKSQSRGGQVRWPLSVAILSLSSGRELRSMSSSAQLRRPGAVGSPCQRGLFPRIGGMHSSREGAGRSSCRAQSVWLPNCGLTNGLCADSWRRRPVFSCSWARPAWPNRRVSVGMRTGSSVRLGPTFLSAHRGAIVSKGGEATTSFVG
jgi:hypothetical protein